MMANSYNSERLRALGDCLERQADIQTDQSWSRFCEWKMTGTLYLMGLEWVGIGWYGYQPHHYPQHQP